MQWYYANDGQRLGPVPHAELERLVQTGTIVADTLVWRQGMDRWQTLAEVKAADPSLINDAPPPLPPPEPEAAGEAAAPARRPMRLEPDEGPAAPEVLLYAGFWRRAGAFLVDLAVWFAVWQILSNIVVAQFFPEAVPLAERIAASGGGRAYQPSQEEMMLLFQLMGILMLVGLVLAIIYDAVFLLRFSATPGKLLCGLRVVHATGRPIGFIRIVARCLAKILSGFTLGIGYLIAAFDDQKRGLHDYVCGTRVIIRRR